MGYKNLLLIDDDEDDQEIFLEALKIISHSVTYLAHSLAQDALKKLISQEIDPDVIFLDLNMPMMNGHQFLIEIKKIEGLKSIPVIMFSTTSHIHTIQISKDLGAHAFITKPRNFEELIKILKPLID
jgi:CheY-like chemotaxis protein